MHFVNSKYNQSLCLKKVLLLLALFIAKQVVFGQDSTGTSQQVWPQLNIAYKINEKFRFSVRFQTTRPKNSENDEGDGNAKVTLDYFALPWLRGKKIAEALNDSIRGSYLWLRLGYFYRGSPEDAEKPTTENTIITEANGRFNLPLDILLTDKNRLDWRIVNGEFMPRYRARLTFQKDMHTEYLQFTPYVYGEYFLDFKNSGADKFRLCGGTELKVAKDLNFEVYYLYQFDNGKDVNALKAVGFSLNFHFNRHDADKLFSKKKKNS